MTRVNANLLLLSAAALWGFGNVAQKTVLEHIDPMSAVGARCLLAALLLALFVRRSASWRLSSYWTSLLRVALPFTFAMAVQQVGYLGTSVTNASFLVNTATVLTPLVAWVMLAERAGRTVLFAAAATLAGALALSGGLSGGIGWGDATMLLSAAGYAYWMVELGRHVRRHDDAVACACFQFLVAGVVALPLGVAWGGLSGSALAGAWRELLVLGVFSTAIAFGLQAVAQRHASASHAAVIVSAESVFGALAAALLLGERVTAMEGLGCALIALGILAVAMPERRERMAMLPAE